jgi:hypothetical protein
LRDAFQRASSKRPSTMPPIRLSDAELDAVMAAARPLAVHQRDGFLQAVATRLQNYREIGPGTVHRVIVEMQKQYWDPPEFGSGTTSKYR